MKRNGKDSRDSRHDLSNDFVKALADDWKQHGIKTIERVREQTPERYIETISKIVPREMLLASDRPAQTNEVKDSKEIADRLLADVGLDLPSDNARERAIRAYDEFILALEAIRDDMLSRRH